MKGRALFILSLGLIVGVSGAVGSFAGAAREADGEGRAVASVMQIMDSMVIPTSADIWNVAREAPADEEAWEALARSAVLLAESGNLLLIGDRAKDDEVWRATAMQLVEGGAQALAAVEARDVEAVNESGNVLIDACEICHERHLPRD